jgi:hypothetical protein
LKPYRFIEDITLQLVLINFSDLVTNELIYTENPKPLLVENKDYERIKFEPINNNLTHGNIIGTNVLIHTSRNPLIYD